MSTDAFVPGAVVVVRDEEWLVTQTEETADGSALSVQGLSDLVRGTTATFFPTIDTVTALDPREATVRADDSASYVDAVAGAWAPQDAGMLVAVGSVLSSVVSDFQIRSTAKSHIRATQVERLAMPDVLDPLMPRLLLRSLRLNCLTEAYADLWAEVWDPAFAEDDWLLDPGYPDAPRLGDVGPSWTPEVPLRRDIDRRNALVEIDALMATMLGITAEELSTIYRTQFAVLHGYDQNVYIFDANGRIVPTSILQVWRRKGDKLAEEERTATHPAGTVYTYDLPFAPRDREADFQTAMSTLDAA
ncbi:MAG: hypothetical protein Q4P15_13250 [Propionibacteriaceae bacterium]|nr:hypothetical protein [Propionibacteriaceae bacterium]